MRILFVEDSIIDYRLIERHIRQAGIEFEGFQVDNQTDFSNALSADRYSIILSDYNLPRFSPYQALEVLNNLQLDIPMIIISGAIRDIEAAQILKAGASDFVSKEDLTRLVPAIDRELKEADGRRERLSLTQKLQMAKDDAELASTRKSRVLAFVAHEFKNPLRGIKLFTEMLLNDGSEPLSPKQKDKVEAIAEACEHVRKLTNDINDVAPIEAGQFKLNYEKLLLRPLLDEVRNLMSESARRRKIKVIIQMEKPNLAIEADKQRLRQILINLLSNAIKYTIPEDYIIISANKLDNQISLKVSDHGPGIPPEELKSLFQDFYRVKNTLSTQVEGLGLGLALTKILTESHNGTITVTSEVGKGCVFEILIPQMRAIAANPDPKVASL